MARVAGFQWDAGNRQKCRRHGVSIVEIEYALMNRFSVFPDPAHSQAEQRFIAIGRTEAGRHLFVVFTLRRMLIRPVSARCMHRKEIAHYEKEAANPEG